MRTPRKDANIVDAPDGLVSDCQSVIAEWKRHASPPQESISRHCLKINTPPALEEAVPSPLVNPFPPLPFSVCSTNKPSLFPNRARDSLQPGIVERDPLSRFCQGGAPCFPSLKMAHLLRELSNGNVQTTLCKYDECERVWKERIQNTLFRSRKGTCSFWIFTRSPKCSILNILKQFWNGKIC